MMIKEGELHKLNVKLHELAAKESKGQITEEEYKEQSEPLKVKAYELTQNYIKEEKEKMYKKKEPEKKTVATKLSQWW